MMVPSRSNEMIVVIGCGLVLFLVLIGVWNFVFFGSLVGKV